MQRPERLVAGVFAGAGAMLLLYQGQTVAGVAILSSMVAFFTGEANGKRAVQG
jgi:uncharacterized membrane-anchored protein YitT (DUF2179 family)